MDIHCLELTANLFELILNKCVHLGREKAVDLLLNNGADVNQASNKGWTPLHWASKAGKTLSEVNELTIRIKSFEIICAKL